MLMYEKAGSVAVVFRQGMDILVPPFEVPIEQRLSGETYEKTAHRLAQQVGINGSVSHSLITDTSQGEPDRAYLMIARNGELADSDFLVPAIDATKIVDQHPRLNEIEKALLRSALRALEHSGL
jgi:hypothetical protein